ncbi:MAG: carbohydrate ABC transporter permease [Candidatus Merdivicinus sp.]|jgi:putative aldouronate transport system permease protein
MPAKAPKKQIQYPLEDRIYYGVVNLVLSLFTLVILLPLINIVAASFSSPTAVATSRVVLWPVEFSLKGYSAVFSNPYVLTGYRNTIFYTILGTLINVSVTLLAAYPLSRKDLPFRGFFMFLFTFTMFFSGGLIPTYLLVNSLRLVGSFWSLLLPGALSVYNMILTRTFMQSNIPSELLEAAQIDGCSDLRFFFNMVLPLSKAVIAVIALYYAVGHWNAYFDAMIYLNEKDTYPLQLILRDILIANQISTNDIVDDAVLAGKQGMADLLKYSLIIVSSLPIICVYPFVQKYFVKGVMIGSVKG